MTDLHVVAGGELPCGRVTTNAYVREAVAHVNGLDPLPDAVVVSGDLVDNGTAEEYAELREILAPLRPPMYVIPGNHDDRQPLLEAFADHAYLPRPGARFVHYAVDDHPVRLVGVDTIVPGRGHGELCRERLSWLDATLAAGHDRPTFVFMHHPPFRTGIGWLDEMGLGGDARALEEVVRRHPQVLRVACGHVHRPIHVAWGGTIASTCPSACHQAALRLTDSMEAAGAIAMEPRAVELHLFDPDRGIVSHLSYVGGYEEFKVGA